MVVSLLRRINFAVQRFQQIIDFALGKGFPPDVHCLVAAPDVNRFPQPSSGLSVKDIFGDGFLWAVPKHRRTLERRHKRKFGHPDYVLKILIPKTHLRTCNVCGDDYEAGVLCPTCYKKVIDETKEMQEAIQTELKLEPVEKEVVVLYENEKDENPDETFEGKRIVELKKPRPAWFSKNLLQQTTKTPAVTSDVKPSELG